MASIFCREKPPFALFKIHKELIMNSKDNLDAAKNLQFYLSPNLGACTQQKPFTQV